MALPPFKSIGTDAIHAGQEPDPSTGAVIPALSLSTTFVQRTPGEFKGYEYQRTGNPTRANFEALMAKCENCKYGLAFSSGMAATSAVLNIFKHGDHILSNDDIYGGTNRYFQRVLRPQGFDISLVDINNEEEYEKAFKPTTKLVWLESPTNPTLKLCDIKKACEIAHKHGALVAVDNTFMTPYFQRPADLGADFVIHSVSKYINGHSDVIGGLCLLNDKELYDRVAFIQNGMGGILSPFDSFQAMRGMKTLHVRMREHEKNAKIVAEKLEAHPKVTKVVYPGLKSHPQHELACRQMTGFGGMITFYLVGGLEQSRQFLENLKLIALAESLGGVESLIEHPAIMTHASVPPEERKKLNISDSLIRLSVGIEDIDDLCEDLDRAFAAVKV